MALSTGHNGGRPLVMGANGALASGHYLATAIGLSVLRRGGNAMDAAAAVGFALTVLKPHQNGIGGEAPVLVYCAASREVRAISGHGVAPRRATLDFFRDLGVAIIPGDGLLPALVPATVATWIHLLAEHGTLRLADVLEPALELAEQGFPMYDSLHEAIAGMTARFSAEWPSSAHTYLADGVPPPLGALFKQPALGAMFRKLLEAEAGHRDRAAGLEAARERFYAGDIAAEIVAHCAKPVRDASGRANLGLLEAADMAGFRAQSEAPTQTGYRGLKVYKCNTWTQGPALLQALNILETFDIRSMEHNGVRYLHTLIEAIKLAYADREFYYGDPLFSEIPLARLLGSEYARQRAALITERASFELRPGGAPALVAPDIAAVEAVFEAADIRPAQGDTTKLDVVDRFGNVVSATPSGGWLMSSPVIAGLGFPLGTRGQMFSLVLGHPNVVAPGKRPRTTLTPSLALQDGRELLGFGSPGGDSQDQWALQFLLSFVDFGMSLQEAVEAPTVNVAHFPASFYPRRAEPGVVYVEARIAESVTKELEARGHLVRRVHPWSQGNTLAVRLDSETGVRSAAASPRLDPAYALAY